MQNKLGAWVSPEPTAANFAAAAAGAKWASAPGFYLLLLDQPGANVLADHRRDLHPHAYQADQCARPLMTSCRSSTGRTRTATPQAASLDYVPLPDRA